jgi:multiple sugar transport system permease protein
MGHPLAGAGDLAMTDVVTEQPLTGAPGRRVRRVRRVPRGRKLILAGLAYLIAIIFLLPYAEMVITALRPNAELLDRDYVPRHWTFSNFTSIWASGFGTNLKISLEVAGGATALVLLVALPAAYYTARRHFPGRGVFLLLVLVTQMLQPAAMLVGIQREFLNFDLPSAVLSLILVNAGFNLAFAVWILNAYFSSVPVELEEAAMVDGAGRLGALGRITLPLAMPGIVTALIFTFIAAWNEFIVALTLATSPDEFPLTVAINNYVGQYSVDWGHLFAGSVIATIPVIILFAFIEGKVVGGLTAGSIK